MAYNQVMGIETIPERMARWGRKGGRKRMDRLGAEGRRALARRAARARWGTPKATAHPHDRNLDRHFANAREVLLRLRARPVLRAIAAKRAARFLDHAPRVALWVAVLAGVVPEVEERILDARDRRDLEEEGEEWGARLASLPMSAAWLDAVAAGKFRP